MRLIFGLFLVAGCIGAPPSRFPDIYLETRGALGGTLTARVRDSEGGPGACELRGGALCPEARPIDSAIDSVTCEPDCGSIQIEGTSATWVSLRESYVVRVRATIEGDPVERTETITAVAPR